MNKVSKLSSLAALALGVFVTTTPFVSSANDHDQVTLTKEGLVSHSPINDIKEQIRKEFIKILALNSAKAAAAPNPLFIGLNWSSWSGDVAESEKMRKASKDFENGINELKKKIKAKLLNNKGCISKETESIITDVADKFGYVDQIELDAINSNYLEGILDECNNWN